jgi:outer membrane protein OmpA-like peptidoglycan-associated protein
MKPIYALSIGLPALLVACAHTPKPTPQLEAARQAYSRAANGPAAQAAPGALWDAHESLERAEEANRDDDSHQADVADLARTRAEIADQQGRMVVAARQREVAARVQAQPQSQPPAPPVSPPPPTASPAPPSDQGATNAQGASALMRLADQTKGTDVIITSHLGFPRGGAQLSPDARQELDQVAAALLATSPLPSVEIDGFADASGSSAANQSVSQERAASVARYLTSRGVPQNRMIVRGMGATTPPGESAAGEGNRRVEIHVAILPTQTQ